jgi:hypothetical protein
MLDLLNTRSGKVNKYFSIVIGFIILIAIVSLILNVVDILPDRIFFIIDRSAEFTNIDISERPPLLHIFTISQLCLNIVAALCLPLIIVWLVFYGNQVQNSNIHPYEKFVLFWPTLISIFILLSRVIVLRVL